MSFMFITVILLIVVAVAAGVAWRVSVRRQSKDVRYAKITTLSFVALSVVMLAFSSFTIVPTKQIGVVTEFGRPTIPLSNGFHFVPPWSQIHHIDAAIQTDSNVRNVNVDDDDDTTNFCTDVRIGNQSIACVDTTTRWRVREDAGTTLYQDYKTFEAIRDSLVTRARTSVLNDILATYDPIVKVGTDGTTVEPPTLAELSKSVTVELQKRVGDRIIVDDVTITLIHFDEETQNKINAYQAEVANTRIATQEQLTAAARAVANQALADSVSNDPNVLVAQCMNTLSDMVRLGQPVPAGFTCWPNGEQPSLLVNGQPTPR